MTQKFATLETKKLEVIPTKNKIGDKMTEVKVPEKPGLEFGIEETQDVLDAAISVANSVILSLADGKLNLFDVVHFIKPITKLPQAISGLEFVPSELDNLSPAELDELIGFVKTNLELEDDGKAKLIAEKSIRLIYDVYDLVKLIKK